MSGSSLTEADAERWIEAYKEDVGKFTGALQTLDDEEREKMARASIADALRQIALLSLFLGDDDEAAENVEKATDWYLKHVDAIGESETLALEGRDGARTLVHLLAVAVLDGDDRRSEASAACLAATVEGAEEENLVAFGKLLAALVGDGDVADRLAALDTAEDAGPEYLSSAVGAVRAIHEERPAAVVDGIEGVLAAHPPEEGPAPGVPVSLEALALYTIARERSLVAHEDISTDRELLPGYRPGDQ
jgi:hypothetical protein